MKQMVMSSSLAADIINAVELTIGNVVTGLHEPSFGDVDKVAMQEVIEIGFVSSTGPHLDKFENQLKAFTGAEHVVAVSNGTAALSLALLASGIVPGQEVLIPALTFVATGNAVLHAGAIPHFIESDSSTLGVNTKALIGYLEETTTNKEGRLVNVKTGRVIAAIMPVHVFGHIGDMTGLTELAREFNLLIIEDAAEALGSFQDGIHAGCFGKCGIISFNGNKIITTGGGGVVLTNDPNIATTARHLATTAKIPHRYEYFHDRIGFNFRMPALNAALGCAQMEKLPEYLKLKKKLKDNYSRNFANVHGCEFIENPAQSQSNNWLNAIQLTPENKSERNTVLNALNERGFGSRPIWALLNTLPHFADCPAMALPVAEHLAARIINIPSSPFLACNSENIVT